MNWVKPDPNHVFVFLDKALYDDYRFVVASNKQQIYVGRSQTSMGKPEIWSTTKRGEDDSSKNKSATVASSWVEDKYGSIK